VSTRGLVAVAVLTLVLSVGAAPVEQASDPGLRAVPPVSGAGVDGPTGPAPVLLQVDPRARDALSGRPARVEVTVPDAISVVSARQGLDAALVASLALVDGIVATALVRSATVGLLGSRDGDGVQRDVVAAGYRIPVTVTALDPQGYGSTLVDAPDEDGALLELLEPGRALLSVSSAALRGIGAGGTVDLGGAAGLEVIGIVGDRTARGSEFLVHLEDADAVGLGRRESLLLRHAPGAADLLADRVAQDGGEGLRLWHDRQQIRLVLSQVEMKLRFGEFAFRLVPDQREVDIETAFVAEHITVERMPVLGNVRCHRLIMDDLRAALDEVVAAGLEDWLARSGYGGCFHPRRIAVGQENLSRHAWGIAIDLNVDFSQPGLGPVPPEAFISIMGRHGFRWGGDFATPDNHHFEWLGEAAQVRPVRGGP
jgi:hypothetical protein